jgi:hypothetical protein
MAARPKLSKLEGDSGYPVVNPTNIVRTLGLARDIFAELTEVSRDYAIRLAALRILPDDKEQATKLATHCQGLLAESADDFAAAIRAVRNGPSPDAGLARD